MKKISIVIIALMILGAFFLHNRIKNDYLKKVQQVDQNRLAGSERDVSWLGNCFPYSDYNLHNQLVTMVPDKYITGRTGKTFLQLFFGDSLNEFGHILLYVPLYSRQTNKKESLVLISAGIDGKLNTQYNVGDTIYDDEYLDTFNFYNVQEYINRESMKFNIWDYLFGKKDYLVRYYNCVDNNDYLPMTLEYEKYRMHPKRIKESISLIAAFEKDTLIDNQRTIVLKSWIDGYRAYCKMHKPIQQKIVRGDTLMISGFLENISEDGAFYMTHSILKEEFPHRSLTDILKSSKLDKRQLLKRNEILKME